jgi:hypothetical protein
VLKRRAGCPADSRGTPALRKSLQKRKRPRLKRVMGRSSNSPPPKSAHKQPNVSGIRGEWLQRASYKIVIGAARRVNPHENMVSRSRGSFFPQ